MSEKGMSGAAPSPTSAARATSAALSGSIVSAKRALACVYSCAQYTVAL
jgi:hypothetical protein